MIASLALGIVVAAAHHLFYRSLQGMETDAARFNQNQNVYIGTALAVIVKASFTAALCAAYAQVLWSTFLGDRLEVGHIDSLSTLVVSPASLDDWRLIAHFPGLVVLAILAWLLPIMTVFPPGTLAVHTDVLNTSLPMSVPTLDFTRPLVSPLDGRGASASGLNINSSDPNNFQYTVPVNATLKTLTTITSLTGEIPRMPSVVTNSSYSIRFAGPTLQCTTAEVQTSDMSCFYSQGGGSNGSTYQMNYLSFLRYPLDSTGDGFGNFFGLDANIPLAADGNISCDILNAGPSLFSNKPAELYVVAQTSDDANATPSPEYGWSGTTCRLLNATYHVTVDFQGPDQHIALLLSDIQPLQLVDQYLLADHASDAADTGSSLSSLNMSATTATEIFNYMGMMRMMASVTYGVMTGYATTSSQGVNNMEWDVEQPIPTIFQTMLANSPELQAVNLLNNPLINTPTKSAMQFNTVPSTGAPLAEQLEQLFSNLTLALMTTTLASTDLVTVWRWAPVNRYTYTAWHLWLAYGVGLLVTAFVMTLGFVMISRNGRAYTTKFSTYLRTTPWTQAGKIRAETVMDKGAGPVPSELARTKIWLGSEYHPTGDGLWGPGSDAESNIALQPQSVAKAPYAGSREEEDQL